MYRTGEGILMNNREDPIGGGGFLREYRGFYKEGGFIGFRGAWVKGRFQWKIGGFRGLRMKIEVSVGFWSINRGKVGKSREFDDFWKIGKNREK